MLAPPCGARIVVGDGDRRSADQEDICARTARSEFLTQIIQQGTDVVAPEPQAHARWSAPRVMKTPRRRNDDGDSTKARGCIPLLDAGFAAMAEYLARRDGESGDVGVAEPVGVVVLGVLVSCGGEVGGELFHGDGRAKILAQRGEQACRRPRRAAEQGVDIEVVAGGAPVVEGAGLGRGPPDQPPHVIILTTFDLDDYVYAGLRAGAAGFLLKDSLDGDLLQAVRAVADGHNVAAPTVTRRLIQHFVATGPRIADTTPLNALTAREREVLKLIADGLSNQQIAARLAISEGIVKTHVSRILAKLALRDRIHAVIYAYESGIA
jgi:DNA-binding NarL/FixJ family response regulator